MYAPPPVAAVPVRRRAFNAPLAAICCLGLILLLIAATIVLALIPIYLPRKDVNAGTTNPFSFTLTPDQTLGDDGPLSADAQNSLANSISTGAGLPAGSLALDSAVAATSSRRRRQDSDLERDKRATNQKVYCRGRFRHSVCGLCRIINFLFSFALAIIFGGISQSIFWQCLISSILGSIPPIQPSSTTPETTAAVG